MCLADFQPLDTAPSERGGVISEQISLFKYDGRAGQAVRRLKYSRITSLIKPTAELIFSAYQDMALEKYDMIVPVPIHWRRRMARGFNQAECLASLIPSEKIELKALIRIRATRQQVGLNREERVKNLRGAFLATEVVAGRSILLIDDVITSGHTAQECALALIQKGAQKVGLLTLTAER